ncbi:MAG TPA: bZIP transcription factor [bacterium]|nr:bZIP transcription factor [bacterium]
MRVSRVLPVFVAALLLGACHSRTAEENVNLKSRVQELEQKVTTLEADNARLKEQIRLLTNASASLSDAMKVQQQLGTLPSTATPASSSSGATALPSASPSPAKN